MINDISQTQKNKISMNDKQVYLFNYKNILIFEVTIFIFLLFPGFIKSQLYIDIKVKAIGNIQILSNDYIIRLPQVRINGNVQSLNNKKISVDSLDDTISLIYSTSLNDFSKMFKNLESITYVYMYNQIGGNTTFSYMFQNCVNLKTFIYEIQYNHQFSVKDMRGMF